jgi:cobalt-zinc-cadmium efflux system outer membrane protein
MRNFYYGTLTLLLALLTSGCATVKTGLGFSDVQKTISDRTGQRIHWNQGGPEDEAVHAEVRKMLSEEFSAEKAVQIALLNNRNLQATYEDLNIAQADLVSAGLLRNPIFDAEVRFAKGGGTGLELALVQDFIDILYIPLKKRIGEAAFEAAKLRVAGAVIDLGSDVRGAFYTYQASEQNLEMRRQILSATDASYSFARSLRTAGNISELELSNGRALFEQSKLDVRRAEVQVLFNREILNNLMGVWGRDADWKVRARLPELPAEEISPNDLEKLAIEHSLELGISRQELERAATSMGVARPLGVFGDVGLGASAEREAEGGEWGVGPAFSLPLPIFNQGQPVVASAQAVLRALSERYAGTAITLRSQVRTAYAAVISARDQANYYKQILLPLREEIIRQTQLQYNAMQIGAFQLLQAKQGQIDAGAAYIDALKSYWLARTKLERLLNGRMTSFQESAEEDSSVTSSARGRGEH